MFNKKIVLLVIFLIGLLAVGLASAADNATEDIIGVDNTTENNFGIENQVDVLSENQLTFTDLNETINGNNDENIYLNSNYAFSDSDNDFTGGIVIDRDVVIYGNGHTINGNNQARIFKIVNGHNVVLYDINFVNGHVGDGEYGGAVSGGYMINCNFTNNTAFRGGAINGGYAVNCMFADNYANGTGGAAYFSTIVSSAFSGNSAAGSGKAIYGGYYLDCDSISRIYDIDMSEELHLHFDVSDFSYRLESGQGLSVKLLNSASELMKYIDVEVTVFKDNRKIKTYSCASGDNLNFEIETGIYTAEFRTKESGLNVNPNNITLMIFQYTFTELNNLINGNQSISEINLNGNYTFYSANDSSLSEGIVIDRDVVIYGNGHTISGNREARIFKIVNDHNVVLYDINFVNGYVGGNEYGGAVSGGYMINCNFTNNTALRGGAINGGYAVNCIFADNYANGTGGAAYYSTVISSAFSGNSARGSGEAIYGGKYLDCDGISPIYDIDMAEELKMYFDVDDIVYNSYHVENLLVNLFDDANNHVRKFIAINVTIFKDDNRIKTFSCFGGDELSYDLETGNYIAEFRAVNTGLNIVPKNITITIPYTFTDLNDVINGDSSVGEIHLDVDYSFRSAEDSSFKDGIVIDRDLIIYGDGHTINGESVASIFNILGNSSVLFYNINFINANAGENANGSAIHGNKNSYAINCNFSNNRANNGGAVYNTVVMNSIFTLNLATGNGGAVYGGTVIGCNFTLNIAQKNANTMYKSYYTDCLGQEDSYFWATNFVLTFDIEDFVIKSKYEELLVNLVNPAGDLIKLIDVEVNIYKNGRKIESYSCISGDKLTFDLDVGTYIAEFKVSDSTLSYNPKNITLRTNSWTDLNDLVDSDSGEIYLNGHYTFYSDTDSSLKNGVVIDRDLIIYGNGLTLDGSNNARMFKIIGNYKVEFHDINFINAKPGDFSYGGAIYGNSHSTAINCNFTNNEAPYGGAIAYVDANNCTFISNEATYAGGAMVYGNALNSTFISNYATGILYGGGAMYKGSAEDCTFISNSVQMKGGAVSDVFVVNCNFVNNSAEINGGAINGGYALFSNFTNNSAENGGAIYGGNVISCNFDGNKANNKGNALVNSKYIACSGQPLSDFIDCQILNLTLHINDFILKSGHISGLLVNLTDDANKLIKFIGIEVTIFNDGSILQTYSNMSGDVLSFDLKKGLNTIEFRATDSNLQIVPKNITVFVPYSFIDLNEAINGDSSIDEIYLENDYIYDSSGDSEFKKGIVIDRDLVIYGGGHIIDANNLARIFHVVGGNVVFYNVTFKNANADGDGGAIWGNSNAINCNFISNHATNGGAVADVYLLNCTFSENTASDNGGAMYQASAVNCTFTNNSALYGGAIYGGQALNSHFSSNNADIGSEIAYGYYLNSDGITDPYMSEILILNFDVDDYTTEFGSAGQLLVNLTGQKYAVPFIHVKVVIYKGDEKIRTCSCLSNDDLTMDLPVGNYTIEMKIVEQGIEQLAKNITWTVKKAHSNVEVAAVDVTYPGDVIVTVKSDVDGQAIVKVGNRSKEVNLTANVACNVTLTDLSANEQGHVVYVTLDSENFTGFNDSVKVVVHKFTPTIEVIGGEFDYSDVIITVKSDVGGRYVLTVGGLSRNINLDEGVAKNIDVWWVDASDNPYDVIVSYDASENYTAVVNDSAKLTVHRKKVNINVTVDEVVYPNAVVVRIESDILAGCFVKVGDVTKDIYIYPGNVHTLYFDNLAANEEGYVVNVTHDSLNSYGLNDSERAVVHKFAPTIEVVAGDMVYGSAFVTVKSDISGDYVVHVGDKSFDVSLDAGVSENVAVLNVDAREEPYIVNVTYEGNENYASVFNDSAKLILHKCLAQINVTVEDVSYPGDVVVNVVANISGEYRIKVGNMYEDVALSENIVKKVIFTGLAANENGYVINVTYGSSNINIIGCNDSVKVVVHKFAPTIEVIGSDATYPDAIILNITSDVSGEYTVKCGDNLQNVNLVANEMKQVSFSQLKPQEYIINVTYDETENYTSAINDNVIVNVLKTVSSVEIDEIAEGYYNRELTISFNVEHRTNVRAVISKSGMEVFNQTVSENYISLKLDAGEYVIKICNEENDTVASSSDTKSFKINKINTTIIPAVEFDVDHTLITVNVDENAAGFVSLTFDDFIIFLELKNGTASFNTILAPGAYNVFISFIGDDNFNGNDTSLEFVVTDYAKENTNISLNVISHENNVTFAVSVNPDARGLVKFEVSGNEEYTVYSDVVNGKAILDDILKEGEYTVIATYMGDSRFNTNITMQTFVIKGHVKQNTSIEADIKLDANKVTITVNVNENATGFVSLKIDDTIAYVPVSEGIASFNINLPAGSYNVDVVYLGDDDFNPNATALSFTVVDKAKENTSMAIDVQIVENNVTFTVIVNENATGIVKFVVSGAEEYIVYADVVGGVGVLDDVLVSGDYTVVATYLGDERFNSNTTSRDFNVVGHIKKDTAIKASEKINGNKVTITVDVDEDAGGFVRIKFDDTVFNVELKNGVATLTTTFEYGSYNLNITYLGDDNYNVNSTVLSFTVVEPSKENTTIDLDIRKSENNVTFTVVVNENATGIVKFVVSGAEEYIVYADVVGGVAVLDDVLASGDYTVVATYMGDGRFNSNTTSRDFNVSEHVKKDTPINANININGYRVTIGVDVNENATGFVRMKLGDTIANIELVNGVGSIIMDLDAGSYYADLTYLGNDDFNPNSTKVMFTVVPPVKENTPISLNVDKNGSTVTFTVNVDPNATGIVKFVVSGVEEYILYSGVESGKAVIDKVLNPGNYTVKVTYMGDSRFNLNATFEEFSVDGSTKKDTPISVVASVNGFDVAITGNIDINASGVVLLQFGENNLSVPIKDGKFAVSLILKPGNYNVLATYSGDDYFNINSTSVSFTVKEPTVLSAPKVSVSYRTAKNMVVTLKDSNAKAIEGKLVSVKLNGKTYTKTTNAQGQISVAVPITLVPKTYVASITFAGDDKYVKSTISTNVVVSKVTPKITAKKKTFKRSKKVKKYAIILKDDWGMEIKKVKVTLKVKGKTYTAKTNSRGKATFKIKNLKKKGKFTAKITFKGNKYYNKVTKKAKIIVKK